VTRPRTISGAAGAADAADAANAANAIELFATRTPTLPPATTTNSWALGRRDLVLVEPSTPFEDERAAWLAWARGFAARGARVRAILLTHHPPDHAGAAGLFARALDVPLLLHRETQARVRDLAGVSVRALDDGDALPVDDGGWIALHTPGHAPGHLCAWSEAARTLVAGDMVANGSTIVVPPDDGGDMSDYLAQLRRLAALAPALMLPAHGEPIDEPLAVLAHYVAHRERRERKIAEAHAHLRRAIGRTPTRAEVLPLAYDDTPTHLWPFALMSLEAHLRKLEREGRV
jgi:glyoxylase-like metal-dependent hydrolase (beta-lactamase superfamily II)